VSTDNQHVALPMLVGAPAGGRRRSDLGDSERLRGPDDLPLERLRSPEERQLAEEWFAGYQSRLAMAAAQRSGPAEGESESSRPKPMFLRAIAGRLLGRNQP